MLAPTVFFNRTQALLKLAQSQRNMGWILVHPTLGNLLQRNGVDVMKFLTAAPKVDDQICLVEQAEMFAYRLATHVEVLAKLVQGLAIFLMQSVEQKASARIGQGFEDSVHSGRYATKWLHVNDSPSYFWGDCGLLATASRLGSGPTHFDRRRIA